MHCGSNNFEIERVFVVMKMRSEKKLIDNESVETIKKGLWQYEKFLVIKNFWWITVTSMVSSEKTPIAQWRVLRMCLWMLAVVLNRSEMKEKDHVHFWVERTITWGHQGWCGNWMTITSMWELMPARRSWWKWNEKQLKVTAKKKLKKKKNWNQRSECKQKEIKLNNEKEWLAIWIIWKIIKIEGVCWSNCFQVQHKRAGFYEKG